MRKKRRHRLIFYFLLLLYYYLMSPSFFFGDFSLHLFSVFFFAGFNSCTGYLSCIITFQLFKALMAAVSVCWTAPALPFLFVSSVPLIFFVADAISATWRRQSTHPCRHSSVFEAALQWEVSAFFLFYVFFFPFFLYYNIYTHEHILRMVLNSVE